MISRSDLPQLNATMLNLMLIPYEYLKVTPDSIKPIQSDRLPFDDNKYLERYGKIINKYVLNLKDQNVGMSGIIGIFSITLIIYFLNWLSLLFV